MATSDDITRYIRCNKLVGQVLTPLMREYMQLNNVPPATVYQTIMQPYCKALRTKLSQTQMAVIQTLPSSGYEKFDITLMYKIARDKNFKMIIKEHPTRKWGTEPLPHEITIGDDIERIRHCRDNIMHNPNHIVSEPELNEFFDKFIDVGKRANLHLNITHEFSYEQQIRDLRTCPIDPETTRQLKETLKENESLKEMVKLQRFPVFMEKEIELYIEDIHSRHEPLDGKKRIRMVLNGLTNTANLAELINSRLEEINRACKDCLIELDEASEGSLILYLEVQNEIFQSDDLFHGKMDSFVKILFEVISIKPEISIYSYILILHDESYPSDSSSDEEDENPLVETDQKKLVLDLTVQNKVFQTDESLRQNLNTFVEAVVTDMNGQQIKKNNSVSAVLRLHESEYAKSSQHILVCGLCEVDTRIRVKCIDCDLFLCQRCQYMAHAKFKNASLHVVLPLKDVHSHDKSKEREKEFIPVKCEHHNKKVCRLYCVTCDQLVCEDCIAETHETHTKEDISSFCHNRIKKMKTMYSKKRYNFEKIISRLRKMHEIQTNNYSTMENLLIKEKEMAINQINLEYEEISCRYNENKTKFLELMCVKETAFWKCEESAYAILQEVENLFEKRDIHKFLNQTKYLETYLEVLLPVLLKDGYKVHVQHFFPKQYHFKICSETFQTEIIVAPKQVYKCDMSFVKSMTSDQAGYIWIADNERNIKQIEMMENVQTLQSTQLDVAIEEVRCLRNNQIIFTSSTKIMLLKNYEVSELTDFNPYEPSTIHVSHENEIIVGFYHQKTKEKIDKPVISRLELNGKSKQVYKNYETRLLQNELVRSCTTFENGNISYIDSCLTDLKGCVVNIDNNGVVQWKYNGNSVLNVDDHPFDPLEILTTRSNNLLISDKYEGALHIITQMGSLLTIVDVTHIGLSLPSLMTIDISGTLWIKSNAVNQSKLCAIDYSGF